jgi:diguanylate cyclase (GGDEF)-like protein/PAS domain S-box-containing protein
MTNALVVRARLAWRRKTTPYTVREPQAARFRAQQLRVGLALTPWVLICNGISVIAVLSLAPGGLPDALRYGWALAVLLASALGARPWLALRRGPLRDTVSERTLDRVVRNAAVLGLLWAAMPAVLYPSTDAPGQMVVLCISVGLLCTGGFGLSSMPRAALSYAGMLAVGLTVGLIRANAGLHLWVLVLVGTYTGIVMATVGVIARHLGRRMMAEAEAARQTELVELLLHDFEQHASDWLWEIDREGRLDHVSIRLAQALCRTPDELMGASLVDLVAATLQRPTDDEARALDQLRAALRTQQPFRELEVPVLVAGQRQWWSLSGKPLRDEQGQLVGWRGVGSDVTRRRRDHAEMVRLANVDALTGLANRHQFQRHLATLGERPCTLFYLDLDNFKAANDFHGHAVGDRVLQIVAGRFQSQIRYGDLLARLGGDEFALIRWGTASTEAAAALAARLIDTLHEPLLIDGALIQVGTSIGIVRSSDAVNVIEDLPKFADMALYAAKDAGRNTYRFFMPDMNESARRRLSLVNDLHAAVREQQFELHFQPLVHLRSGEAIGAEALVRWHHPQRGMVAPLEFISLAEESGLILPLGTWVLEEACRQAVRWPAHLRVAVNLSAVQFGQRDLVGQVAAILARTGLSAQRLELEITESLLIEDSATARNALQALRQLGVRIALDDFGTGYSSLAYLRSFPLDKLKIDGSFVRSLALDAESYAIVRTIVQLAKALRLDITAECVETREQFDALRSLGCTDAQGYWMARPLPAAEALTTLRDWRAIPSGPHAERTSSFQDLDTRTAELAWGN